MECRFAFMKKDIQEGMSVNVRYCKMLDDECNVFGEENRMNCGVAKNEPNFRYEMRSC